MAPPAMSRTRPSRALLSAVLDAGKRQDRLPLHNVDWSTVPIVFLLPPIVNNELLANERKKSW